MVQGLWFVWSFGLRLLQRRMTSKPAWLLGEKGMLKECSCLGGRQSFDRKARHAKWG